MTQTTAITEAAEPSARVPAPEAVPAEVAQRQLDSALAAELAVPASAGPTPLGPAPAGARPGVLLLLVCLVLLVGVRLLSQGGAVRRRPPAPAPEKAERESSARAPASGARRRSPPAPQPEVIALPPHVAALVRRLDERHGGSGVEAAAPSDPAADSAARTLRPGAKGLDVWVGREPR